MNLQMKDGSRIQELSNMSATVDTSSSPRVAAVMDRFVPRPVVYLLLVTTPADKR
jgi:hypothetical protein